MGAALRTTAGLIRAKVGVKAVKAVAVDSGGWDHHVDLNARVQGTIGDLAASLAAFVVDLGPDAVFALGAGVKGGTFYSRWPTLGSGSQIDSDLAATTDYRSVLSEILRSRFPSVNVSKVFPGVVEAPLGFMR